MTVARKKTASEWLVRQVAEGDSVLDSQTILRLSQQLDITLGQTEAFCLAVRYADPNLSITDAAMPQKLCAACKQAGKQLNLDMRCYIGNHLYTVIVVMDPAAHDHQILKKMQSAVSQHCAAEIQFGVGRCYNAEKLSYSRVEAYEVLRSIASGEGVFYIEDVYTTRSITTYKYHREKRKIVELFKSGNIAQMKNNVELLVENVRAETPVRQNQPYPTSIRRTIVELLVEIMHIGSDAGVDVDAELNHEDPYTKILEMSDTPNILRWFFSVVENLQKAISEQHSKTESSLLSMARKKIEEHLFDAELSLSLMSEELNITPTYFSAFFIREMGVGFQEYVTDLRIEKAKQLLRQTNMKINTIASQCGFRSASYFIVVFRKQLGMSPGEYRSVTSQNES